MKIIYTLLIVSLIGFPAVAQTAGMADQFATISLILKNSSVQDLKIQMVNETGNFDELKPAHLGGKAIDTIYVEIPVAAYLVERQVWFYFSKGGPGCIIPVLQPGDHLKIVSDLSFTHIMDHTTFEGSERTKELFEYNKRGNDLSGPYLRQRDKYMEALMAGAADTLVQKHLMDSLNENRSRFEKETAFKTNSPAILLSALLGVHFYHGTFTGDQYNVLRQKFSYDPYTLGQIDYCETHSGDQNDGIHAPENTVTAKNTMLSDFSLPDVNGNQVSLSKYRGKYILVDFWASWCGPCRREAPYLKEAMKRFGNKNLIIISNSIDVNHGNWQSAIKEDGTGNFIQLIDDKGWNAGVIKKYGITAIPSNFLIDPSGKIIDKDLRGEDLIVRLFNLYKSK